MLFQSRQPAPAETSRRPELWRTAKLCFDRVPPGVKRL
jgi:hypothetical protein